MDEIGRNYLTLALSLDRHFEGFVDAYFGPPELKAEIEAAEPRSLEALAEDARQIRHAIGASDYNPQRKDFLTRQTWAMAAVIHNLSGDQLDFVEEVELYFDIAPEIVDEEVFEAIHAEIDRLLPGDSPLYERMMAWDKTVELQGDQLARVVQLALHQARGRTLALFDLPPGEEVALSLVEDQPWAAYNWYRGNYRSRIEVNADVPVRIDQAIRFVAHEAYPGHHTEHAIKENRLCREEGRAEHAIQLLLAPEAVLSEGIAESAQDMIFGDEELVAFLRDEICPLVGMPDVDVERLVGLTRPRKALDRVAGNAALLLHRHARPPDEVKHYLQHYGLHSPEEAERKLRFIQNPIFRSYVFNYTMGKELLAPLLEGPDARANFVRLLSEPFTPTLVRRWVAQRGKLAEAGHPRYNP
jgi:hypothetical protein